MQVGDDAKFTCLVPVSETLPNFRWLKWNKSVNSIPKTYNEILNGSYRLIDPYYYKIVQVKSNYGVELNIVNVTEDDFGLYTCFVSNHIGNDFNSAFLIKNVKPTVPVTGQYLFKQGVANFFPSAPSGATALLKVMRFEYSLYGILRREHSYSIKLKDLKR